MHLRISLTLMVACAFQVSALEGTTLGTKFQEPAFPREFPPLVSEGGSAVVNFSNLDTKFSWGDGTPSSFQYSDVDFSDPQEFSVGLFTYENGASGFASGVQFVDLNLQLNFDINPDPGIDQFEVRNFIFTLGIENTGNDTQIDALNADKVRFLNRTATSTISLPGEPIYNLTLSFESTDPAGFVSEVEGGYANAFHVYEGGYAQASLIARVYQGAPLANIDPPAVPDGGATWLMLLLGTGTLAACRCRNNR